MGMQPEQSLIAMRLSHQAVSQMTSIAIDALTRGFPIEECTP